MNKHAIRKQVQDMLDGAASGVAPIITNLDCGKSGTAGTVDIFPSTAAKGRVRLSAADSAGDTVTTIVNASQAAARTYTIPDAGNNASFVMTEGTQTINGVKTIATASIPSLIIDSVAVIAESSEHGAGVIGTGFAPMTYRYSMNGIIITEIKVDLQGLTSKDTANDVIGLAAGGVAYIGRNVVATNGVIFKIELICLETPAGGDNDVNVVANASATLAYDDAGGTTYGINGGDAVAGQMIQNLVQGLTANHYFYLTAGTGDTAAAYTAGQFIVRLHGHPVLT